MKIGTSIWTMAVAAMTCAGVFSWDEPSAPTAMMITPAAAPVPVLKYRLFPDPSLRTSGNAVDSYYRAYSPEWAMSRYEWGKQEFLSEYATKPLSELKGMSDQPVAAVLTFIGLKELDRGARRRFVDWGLWDRIREEGAGLLLPDLQGLRTFGTALALRARLQMAKGDYPAAAYSLQSCFGLAKHLTEGPTLIHALVGAAVANQATAQVEEWVRTPGSPNLYWAIIDLPTPLIDLRNGFAGERLMIDAMFPTIRERLADRTKAPMSVDESRAIAAKAAKALETANNPIGNIAHVMSQYPAAKSFLRERGFSEAQVEAMPALQTVMMLAVYEYDCAMDEMVKTIGLPAHERLACVANVTQSQQNRSLPLAELLLSSAKVFVAPMRLERKLAALATVEAIRMHAAKTGAMPERLADITMVPVPNDPATNQPFAYAKSGESFLLSAAPLMQDPAMAFRFSIKLEAK